MGELHLSSYKGSFRQLKTSESICRHPVFAFICCVSIHLEISGTVGLWNMRHPSEFRADRRNHPANNLKSHYGWMAQSSSEVREAISFFSCSFHFRRAMRRWLCK